MHLRHISWRQFHMIFFIICAACLLSATCCRRSSMEFSTCGILSAITAGVLWIFFSIARTFKPYKYETISERGKTLQKARKWEDEWLVTEERKKGRPLEVQRAIWGHAFTVQKAQDEGIWWHWKQHGQHSAALGPESSKLLVMGSHKDASASIRDWETMLVFPVPWSAKSLFWIKCCLARPGSVAASFSHLLNRERPCGHGKA